MKIGYCSRFVLHINALVFVDMLTAISLEHISAAIIPHQTMKHLSLLQRYSGYQRSSSQRSQEPQPGGFRLRILCTGLLFSAVFAPTHISHDELNQYAITEVAEPSYLRWYINNVVQHLDNNIAMRKFPPPSAPLLIQEGLKENSTPEEHYIPNLSKDSIDDEPYCYTPLDEFPKLLNHDAIQAFVGDANYPKTVRKNEIEGKVFVRLFIDSLGIPRKHIVEYTSDSALAQVASRMAMNARFTPALQNRRPVKCWISIPNIFSSEISFVRKSGVSIVSA